MSDTVLVTLITVVVGGAFTLIIKFLDRKASQAKDELTQNTSEVEAVNKALEGMQILANNLRTEYDREHDRANKEHDRADSEHNRAEKLEKDLIEEKAINIALTKLKKERGNSD